MQDTIILLLSKYSNNCNKMMQIMKSSELNFNFIETIFIDNANVRKSIISKKDYNITSVPTLLVFKSNGSIEKYDNDVAFKWMLQTIKNLKKIEEDKEVVDEIEEEGGKNTTRN